ncbi:polymer-forming cytoskeletal protein [Clostridium sp.]|uniref:polymer-forming cytoskeletal protein n=1 Tax=Clostridium sp. TaxID=1506 RepID=UPI002FC86A61
MINNEQVGSLRISGSGSVNGGKYDEVSISGSGKVFGDLECNTFKISGSGKVEGNITTNDFKISGSGTIAGSLNCTEGKISGSGKITSDVKADNFKISGSGKIEGDFRGRDFGISGSGTILGGIYGENIRVSGSATVEKNMEGELVEISGSFRVGGMINADEVYIHVGGDSSVEEIGSTKVIVSERPINNNGLLGWLTKTFGNNYGYLKVKSIEADEIKLENTIAEVVRGENITIGNGCRIKVVEYSGELKVEDNAVIEETRKI